MSRSRRRRNRKKKNLKYNNDHDKGKQSTGKQRTFMTHHPSLFIAHMTIEEVDELKANDQIDFKPFPNSKFYPAIITAIKTGELYIECYMDNNEKYSDWFDYSLRGDMKTREYFDWFDYSFDNIRRIAKYGSISRRKPHRLTHLKIDDFVYCNDICTQIHDIDNGQIKVQLPGNQWEGDYWAHLDDVNQVHSIQMNCNDKNYEKFVLNRLFAIDINYDYSSKKPKSEIIVNAYIHNHGITIDGIIQLCLLYYRDKRPKMFVAAQKRLRATTSVLWGGTLLQQCLNINVFDNEMKEFRCIKTQTCSSITQNADMFQTAMNVALSDYDYIDSKAWKSIGFDKDGLDLNDCNILFTLCGQFYNSEVSFWNGCDDSDVLNEEKQTLKTKARFLCFGCLKHIY